MFPECSITFLWWQLRNDRQCSSVDGYKLLAPLFKSLVREINQEVKLFFQYQSSSMSFAHANEHNDIAECHAAIFAREIVQK